MQAHVRKDRTQKISRKLCKHRSHCAAVLIAGYTTDEKRHIARRYLERQARADAGVAEGACLVTDGAVEALISEYCREAGVRNLKKHLEQVCGLP